MSDHRWAYRRAVIASVVAVVLVGGFIGTTAAAHADAVLPGVTVGGISVSGLDETELTRRLTVPARSQANRELSLVVGDRTFKRSAADLGLTVHLEATVAKALRAGRQNPLAWLLHEFGSGEADIRWVPRVDDTRLDRSMKELERLVELDPANGSIGFQGAQPVVTPPTEGVQLLTNEARKTLVTAAMGPSKKVLLPVNLTAPRIGTDELERVQAQITQILAGPVEFEHGQARFSLAPEAVAGSMRAVVEEQPNKSQDLLTLQLDQEELRRLLVNVAPGLEQAPKDASFNVDGEKVTLSPSADGSTIDTAAAARSILSLTATERAAIPLTTTVRPPALSTDAAKALQIKQKIVSYTTTFDAGNAPRVKNIDLMAKAINGRILHPEEVFSLNGATGPRTPAHGYQEANVIVDGELVPGLGGGVCQVATTIFNAAFNAGLDIVDRTNHSLFIDHYPTGRDATVNFGYQDLKFKNDTPYGILLRTSVNSRSITVALYSSPLGRTVESSAGPRTDPKPQPNKYVDDPTLPAGQEVVQEEGSPGFNIVVSRTVRQGDQVLHSDTFVSKYRPWKRIIRRGTGPASPSPTG